MEEMYEVFPWLLAGVALVFVGLHFAFWLTARRLVGRSVAGATPLLGDRLQLTGRTLLYLHSPNCGACALMTPRVERVARDNPGVVLIDIRREPALARRLGVAASPTVLALEGGIIADAVVGVLSERRLRKLAVAGS